MPLEGARDHNRGKVPTVPRSTRETAAGYTDITNVLPPDMPRKFVDAGCARLGSDIALVAEGFSYCSALVLQKEDGSNALLAHLDDWRLRDAQVEEVNNLPPGRYRANVIVGPQSRITTTSIANTDVSSIVPTIASQGRTVSFGREIVVDAGQNKWGLSMKGSEQEIEVVIPKKRVVHTFNLE